MVISVFQAKGEIPHMSDLHSIGTWHAEAASRWSDRDALSFEGKSWTFGELGGWHAAVADWLQQQGVTAGERVLWHSRTTRLPSFSRIAIMSLGAVSVPTPMIYREHELEFTRRRRAALRGHCARQVWRPVEISASRGIDRVLASAPCTHSEGNRGESVTGWELVPGDGRSQNRPGPFHPPAGGKGRPRSSSCTPTGSTANPKGVVHTSDSLSSAARMIAEWCELREQRTASSPGAPIAHSRGLLGQSVLPIGERGKAVLMPRWDAERAARLDRPARRHFHLPARRSFFKSSVDIYESSGGPGHRLSRFICGGATIPPGLIQRAEELGVFAFRSWGMTEAP